MTRKILYCSDDRALDPSSMMVNHSTRALSLESLSNVAESGIWAFRVDGAIIQSGGMYLCMGGCGVVCVV